MSDHETFDLVVVGSGGGGLAAAFAAAAAGARVAVLEKTGLIGGSTKHEFHEDWRGADLELILNQDFTNMELVHKGMKSSGFEALRTSPLQESPLVNFHRALRSYLND